MLKATLEFIQAQEQYPPFFKAIQDAYASNVGEREKRGINETHQFLPIIVDEETSTLRIVAKPEVEIITVQEAFGLRGKHYQ